MLLWARQWLAQNAPRLSQYGIVRLIQHVWAIPGRSKLTDKGVQRVRLRRAHPRARDVCCGFRPLLANSHLEVVLGQCQTGAFWAEILAAESLQELADLYHEQGRHMEAKLLYQRALYIREQAWGSQHPKTIETRKHFIDLLHAMRLYEEASQLEATQSELQ